MEQLSLTGRNKHKAPDALSNLSAVIIDGTDIRLDNAAIHGKAHVERGIRFLPSPNEVPNPRRLVVVWVTLRRAVPGLGINGLGASEFYIDVEAGLGYKNLADQVNKMDGAVRGKVLIEVLTREEHAGLGRYLRSLKSEFWENATDQVLAEWMTAEDIAAFHAHLDERQEAKKRAKEDGEHPSS